MTQPVLNPHQTIAFCEHGHILIVIFGENLDPGITKNDVSVEYWVSGAHVQDLNVKKAKVAGSVLIVKAEGIHAQKPGVVGDDEIVLVVTNPGGAPSEPVQLPVVCLDGEQLL